VVIPAPIRAAAGLRPGTELKVVPDEGSIRLTRIVPGPKLERIGKLLVARPRVPAEDRSKVDMARLVEEHRNRSSL
jgi:bifunctional DNA-binding transcriptional regulator/antitoxin component of YhaV-PrlF toxin-antitoxin module